MLLATEGDGVGLHGMIYIFRLFGKARKDLTLGTCMRMAQSRKGAVEEQIWSGLVVAIWNWETLASFLKGKFQTWWSLRVKMKSLTGQGIQERLIVLTVPHMRTTGLQDHLQSMKNGGSRGLGEMNFQCQIISCVAGRLVV